MQKNDLLKKLISFKTRCKKLKQLLSESRNAVAEIVRNHEKIASLRSKLNQSYAGLEKYIKLFGKNPELTDGVWMVAFLAYETAFSADILQRVGPSLNAVSQDLDYIIGKLKNMSDEDFGSALGKTNKENNQKNDKKSESIGIINLGNKCKFDNCKITGFDKGIENRGYHTKILNTSIAKNSSGIAHWYESWWFQAIIALVVLLIGSYLIWKFGWTK